MDKKEVLCIYNGTKGAYWAKMLHIHGSPPLQFHPCRMYGTKAGNSRQQATDSRPYIIDGNRLPPQNKEEPPEQSSGGSLMPLN